MAYQHSSPKSPLLQGLFSRWKSKTSQAGAEQKKVMEQTAPSNFKTYVNMPGKAVWNSRNYHKFAEEGFIKNVVAHRAIVLIATAAASVDWQVFHLRDGNRIAAPEHPLHQLLLRPNPRMAGAELFENLYAYRLIAGNAFLHATGKEKAPRELHLLRPDRVSILAEDGGMPHGYRYQTGAHYVDYPIHPVTGTSRVLHMRYFHPLSDWQGLSPIEAAAYSIDQHNQAAIWNQSLLQNGARPSGALVVQSSEGQHRMMPEEHYNRLREQITEQFQGAKNAGRPLILEGGIDWREMGMNNRDMDFIASKHSAARDIALAFGVPPQLLGLPGDNTYSNMQEARLALWEETILPLLDSTKDSLNNWLVPMFGKGVTIDYDMDSISALAPRRDLVWQRVSQADFLTLNEKRAQLGLPPIADGDRIIHGGTHANQRH
jgi:HK97 family phage portal protein